MGFMGDGEAVEQVSALPLSGLFPESVASAINFPALTATG